jgi:hypothetical protein
LATTKKERQKLTINLKGHKPYQEKEKQTKKKDQPKKN